MLKHEAGVERQRKRNEDVQSGHDCEHRRQSQPGARDELSEPVVERAGENERRHGEICQVERFIGQIADQLEPAIVLRFGKLLWCHFAGGRLRNTLVRLWLRLRHSEAGWIVPRDRQPQSIDSRRAKDGRRRSPKLSG